MLCLAYLRVCLGMYVGGKRLESGAVTFKINKAPFAAYRCWVSEDVLLSYEWSSKYYHNFRGYFKIDNIVTILFSNRFFF